MGKARREAKLARRDQGQQVGASQKFSWKNYFSLMGKTLPKILLVMVLAVLLQLLAQMLGFKFAGTPVGQMLIVFGLWLALSRWIYAGTSLDRRKR